MLLPWSKMPKVLEKARFILSEINKEPDHDLRRCLEGGQGLKESS
jgi:hypothetical protein